MRAIGLTGFGGPEVLRAVDLPEPHAGPGEIRIRVHAVAVNPADLVLRSGGWADLLAGQEPPYVPGMDVAGIIDELGPDPDGRLAVGDHVLGYVIPTGPRGGSYAELLVLDQRSAVVPPSGAGLTEASTLLLNSVTASLALDAITGGAGGATVAVTGAAGAVGGYAVQLAQARGLTVVADAGPDDQDLVRALGAQHVVPRGASFTRAVRAIFPDGVAGLIDGANLEAAVLPAVADGGVISAMLGWSGPAPRGIRVIAVSSFSAVTDTARLEQVRDLAEKGVLTLRVAGVLPAGAAAEAHRRMAAGGIRGRLVLDFS